MMIPSDFHFERPGWLLALLPAAVLLFWGLRGADRSGGWRDAVDAHLLAHLVVTEEGSTRRWPLALLAVGWLAATLAMAGPSWERIAQPTTTTTAPTVIVLDMSVSMDAADLTPSRLARARHKVQDVLERNRGGQAGLVIYTDEPFTAAPLTDDGRVISEMLPLLTSDLMPGRGSRPARAIDQAAALLAGAGVPGGRILLVADSAGEDPEATRAAAARAAADGRQVSVLAVGTEEGAPIPDGRGGLVRSADGQPYQARLARTELESVASSGAGRFAVVTADDADLDSLLREPLSLGSREEGGASTTADVEAWKDAGVYLLFLPLLLAPFAFRRGWLAVVLLGVALVAPRPADAAVWEDLWQTRDQQGAAAFARGDAAGASDLFEAPDWRAAAQYESGDYDAAREAFAALSGTDNRYNLGNALARGGKFDEAIAAYDEVLAAQPGHEDARHNRDLVERLRDQKRQGEQSSSGEQGEGEQSSSGEQGEGEQSSSGEQGEGEQSSSGEQGEGEQASSGEQGGEEQASSGEQGGEEQASSGEQGGEEQASSGEQGGEEQASSGESDASGAESRTASGSNGEDSPSARSAKAESSGQSESDGLGDRIDEALERTEASPESGALARATEPMTEERQAREQMLRRVPDDPAGLLRAKIQRTYAEKRFAQQRRRAVQQGGMDPWW